MWNRHIGFQHGLVLRDGHRGRLVRQHTLDDGLLLGLGLFATGDADFVVRLLDHRVAGLDVFQTWIVVAQALKLVVRRFDVLVGDQQHGHALLEFDLGDLGALLVQQEGSHFHRHLHVHGGGVVLHGLFLDDAQDLQRRRLGVTDVAGAVATRAGDVRAF